MVLKNSKNSQNFPLVEAPWPVKPSNQIVRDFSEGHELPPAGVSDHKYQMEKKAPNINTHLIVVLVHQLPSLAVCSFGVHEVSNKSRHFLEVDNRRVKLLVIVLVAMLVMLVCSQFSSRNLPLSSWPASGRCSSASS